MTSRQRWLAALRLEPVDRLPFWAKLNGSYPIAQDEPFRSMDIPELHTWVGSEPPIGLPQCVTDSCRRVTVNVERSGDTEHTTVETPVGTLTSTRRFDWGSQSWHPVEFPVKTAEDVKIYTAWCEDRQVQADEEGISRAADMKAAYGESAVAMEAVGKSPLMNFVELIAGVETAHYLLADAPHIVDALFNALHQINIGKLHIMCNRSPADFFMMVENTSTTLISPRQYADYCAAHIEDYAEIASRNDRILGLHMCGHLRDLLPQLAQLDVRYFEAFTSPPVGNTRLSEGRSACPDTCLIGGTNAAQWTRSADEIIAEMERDLAALPHHRGIVLSSSGVMPPLCRPETIRDVSSWIGRYPVNSAA